MKESKYNFFFTMENDSDNFIAYNSRTNALAIIEAKKLKQFQDFTLNSTTIDDNLLIEDLKSGGFLINEDVDELELLKYNQLSARFSTSSLSFTIAPTLGCNFDCIYCFEKHQDDFSKLSIENQDYLVALIEEQATTIDALNISWYGGEPLLAFDVIENLSNRFLEICRKHQIKYSAAIVTNGYLLDKSIVTKMKDLEINHIQVTLDGPSDIHNKRRPLTGGQPTFNKIFENLIDIVEIAPRISLRINVDKENSERINEVIEILKSHNLTTKVHPYLGYVEPTNGCYNKNDCLTFDSFSTKDVDFFSMAQEYFSINVMSKYPRQITSYCCAERKNAFVIDSKGDLYKCWSDIGIETYKIGNLKTGLASFTTALKYALYDCTSDHECKECKYMPICMGGCPKKRIDNLVERCTPYKYTLETYIKKVATNMLINSAT